MSASNVNHPIFADNGSNHTPTPPSDDAQDLLSDEEGISEVSSVEEIQDDEFPTYFRERNGRLYHSHPTSPYPLPIDTPEQERITVVHNILRRIIGRNYQGPVDAVLAVNPARPPRVLDIGTGSGRWVLEMSQEYPTAQFIGIDIVPIQTRYPPSNVDFEIGDMNSRLRWEDFYFDLVHARDIVMGTSDYESLLNEAARVLCPGGLFLSVEWSWRPTFHPTFANLNLDEHAPASVRFSDAIDHIFSESYGAWMDGADASTMITNSVHFTNVATTQIFVPIGTWHQSEGMCRIGSSFRASQRKLANAFRQILLDAGMSSAEVDTLIGDYVEEIQTVEGLMGVVHLTRAERL